MKLIKIASVFVLCLYSLIGYAVTPTQSQLDMFSKLPIAQQKKLAKQYGIDISSITKNNTNKTLYAPTLNDLETPRKNQKKPTQQAKQQQAKNVINTTTTTTATTTEAVTTNKEPPLKPFGYDLFAGEPSTFAPISDVPVPSGYILGPGDTIHIQMYGKESEEINLTVNRQGAIEIPSFGPYQVAGQRFFAVKKQLADIIQKRTIGIKTNITMGVLRSIRVFVLGEAYKPASYTLSSLATVTQAIYSAGGISDIGSLRNIQIKRNGKVIAKLDLYDLLLKGDTSGDIHLLANDVVFIPTVGQTVGIKGEVLRPAIYEFKENENLLQVISLAGGLSATAFKKVVKINRVNKNGLRTIINVNLNEKTQQRIQNGDVLDVASVLTRTEKNITIKGFVARPGVYGWHEHLKLSDILENIRDFKKQADINYILIVRTDLLTGELTSFSVDFSNYLAHGDKASDFEFKAQDTVYVFDKNENRSTSLIPLLNQLKKQANLLSPPKIITVNGAVKYPGSFPLTQKATLHNILLAAGGYKLDAELNFALLAHINQKTFKTEVEYLDLNNNASNSKLLSPLDRLYIFNKKQPRENLLAELNKELKQQASKTTSQNIININGDVKYPGEYPYTQNITPKELVALAGGYNDSSYLVNAELTRFNNDGVEKAALEHSQINLQTDNTKLKPLDSLFIKRIPQWRKKRLITLKGEVQFPGDYVLQQGETLTQVLQRAGGFTKNADLSAAIFTRVSLRKREQEQINRLSKKLKAEISARKLDKSDNLKDISLGESSELAKRLEKTTAIGRLVINLPSLLTKNNANIGHIRLDNGDALYIPKKRQSITVLGEVQYPTSHLYNAAIDSEQYIERSGGLTSKADEDRIYIIKADGSVSKPQNYSLFFNNSSLAPGDTIVVPLDTNYRDNLSLWTSVTRIIYNSAVAVAAISAL